jgi:hypothetical protein
MMAVKKGRDRMGIGGITVVNGTGRMRWKRNAEVNGKGNKKKEGNEDPVTEM